MYFIFKWIVDLAVSITLLVVLLPMMIIVATLIKLESRGELFFIQERVGYQGNLFRLYKFRSMSSKFHEPLTQIHVDSPEVTRVGRLMRRFKIDEVPQLMNVVTGDMSLVGPRPCLEATKEQFNRDGHERLRVRPGLTGLAQVSGNIHLNWAERWALDREYVENMSMTLDVRILLKTVLIVLLGEEWGFRKT